MLPDRRPDACDQLLWTLIRPLYPPAALAEISEVMLFESAADQDTGGFVEPLDDAQTRWRAAYDIDSEDSYWVTWMLVHELGHLLSLGPQQGDPEVPDDGCEGYETGSGCARPGSYLQEYVDDEWGSLADEWFDRVGNADSQAAHDKAAKAFYDDHPGVFVDDYAATDPDEDFAETLAAYALRNPLPTPKEAAKGDWFEAFSAFRDVKARVGALG